MNKWTIAMWAALFAAGTSLAAALPPEEELSDEALIQEGLVAKEEPFDVQLGYNWRAYMFEHSALQRRSDRDSEREEDWREGDLDGDGWGLVLSVARGTSKIKTTLFFADYDYTRDTGDFRHRIETERRDWDIEWHEISGRSDRAHWGWILGIRNIDTINDIEITETLGKKVGYYEDHDDVSWLMAEAGYFGALQPFRQPIMNIYGQAKVLIGEAEGLARSGSDDVIDGVISETWDNEFSTAYGFNGTLGVSFRVKDRVGLAVEYTREWLYSFEATDTGIVVFPDNNDALFIEAHHVVTAYLTVIW